MEFFLDQDYVLPSMQLCFALHSGHQFEANLAEFYKMPVVMVICMSVDFNLILSC